MCEKCEEGHKEHKFTKKHKTIPCDEVKGKNIELCPNHEQSILNLFCEECELSVCQECANDGHEDHKCFEITSKMCEFRAKLNEILAKTHTSLEAIKRSIRATQNQVDEIEKDVDGVKERISDNYKFSQEQIKKAE